MTSPNPATQPDPRRFTVCVPVILRDCRASDLLAMEWGGVFTAHRRIIEETFENQRRGDALMLVADVNGFPAGQVWVNLAQYCPERVGALWALRVFPCLQGHGIGTRLIGEAENRLRERGYFGAEIAADKDNPDALRLYQRLGYRVVETVEGRYHYRTPDGAPAAMELDEWVLRKRWEEPNDSGSLGGKVDSG